MPNPKRKYNKSAAYWDKFHKDQQKIMPSQMIEQEKAAQASSATLPNLEAEGIDTPYMAEGGCGPGGREETRSSYSGGDVGLFHTTNFENIRSGLLPYYYSDGFVNINDTIELCQRAYANVSPIRNTIDVMTEFSNSKIHLKGSTSSIQEFYKKWFEKIGLNSFKEQFFREYYRSGNVFIYKFDGRFSKDDYIKLQRIGVKAQDIPLRFSIINPATIAIYGALGYNFNYVRLLSPYEIARLRERRTDEDKAVYNSLDKNIQKQIDLPSTLWKELYIPLDPEKLYYIFYKKQDYEPFAVPMVFPVLNDVEWKLQLKKMDIALTRTIENVILLVTMGAEKDKGGINVNNIKSMQTLLQNRAVGRCIVSDYTTEAKFIIPEIDKIIGPEKYTIVNQDIQEGLQNILMGSEKFANQFIKTKVFLERLNEGQDVFLNSFLIPQMIKIAQMMGFKECPTPIFEKIDLKDENEFAKVVSQLASLGILSGKQAITTMESGLLPDPDVMDTEQQNYKALRDKGLYYPLVGGSAPQDGQDQPGVKKPNGRPAGSRAPQKTKKIGPIGKGKGGVDGESVYHMKGIANFFRKTTQLESYASKLLGKKHKVKELNNVQLAFASQMVQTIVGQTNPDKWEESIANFINKEEITNIDNDIVSGITDIAAEYDTDIYQASAMFHSDKFLDKVVDNETANE